jgi:hypothetical protein
MCSTYRPISSKFITSEFGPRIFLAREVVGGVAEMAKKNVQFDHEWARLLKQQTSTTIIICQTRKQGNKDAAVSNGNRKPRRFSLIRLRLYIVQTDCPSMELIFIILYNNVKSGKLEQFPSTNKITRY